MKRGITIILAAVMALGLGLGGLSVAKNAQGTKEFISDGYILDPSDEEYVTDNVDTQYYFSAGAKYKEKYGSQIVFKSSTGDNQTIDSQHFIHYNDGSLGAFTKGVLMDVSEINDSNYGYYSLTQNTVLIKNGNSYEMTSRGESMNITEFIWKISDTDYMLVSPNITLNIGSNDVNFSDYVQLTYVDNGIVRLTHQTGTYQTVAADSKLMTQNGTELNLVGKEFIVDGEPVFSLDDMAIDDDSYIDVDENITDQPTIPTFNVINGKDGANGTDGADGEQGIEGEEGKEGEQGSQGDEGAEGTSGTAGGSGGDGVEGDTGIMGYDGAEGLDGKDAETAASASTIVSADLKARPTITIDAGDASTAAGAYNVKSASAEMVVNIDDSDNSLIPGTTKVKLFDKKTMKEVTSAYGPATAESMGSALESGTATLNFNGLTADTEYVLMVEGDYEVDDDGTVQRGVLFQKVFKTEPIGIAIAKDHVSDTEIAAITRVTGSVDSYSVVFFYYDENQTKQTIATFDATTAGSTFLVNDDNPTPGNNGRPTGFNDVKSNTTYYAELANVTSGGQLVNTSGSEVELKTLKQTPCDASKYNLNPKQFVYVSEMEPTLTANNKEHSFTVNLNALADIDQGISGYRVELYKTADISAATSLNEVVPTYVKEMTELTGTTFTIPSEDNSAYRARVVVLFNDNEKDVELTTLFSASNSLSTNGGSLSVEFIGKADSTKKYDVGPDKVSGYIKIADNNLVNTQVLQHINGTHPLTLEISGEFHDVYTITYTDPSDSRITKNTEGGYWLFEYEQKGLHNKSTYTLRVVGPQDTDGDGSISESQNEHKTYLAGIKAQTGTYNALVLMGKRRTNTTNAAFEYGLFLAPSVPDSSGDTAELEGADYSVSALENLELRLYRFDGVREVELGSPAKLVDTDLLTHTSDFTASKRKLEEGAENDDLTLGEDGKRGLILNDTADDTTNFSVKPTSFGIADEETSLYSGGIYKIKVVSAKDYTGSDGFVDGAGGNDIPFVEGKDLISFSIEKTHVRNATPYDAVSVTILPNSAAANGYEEQGISSSTPVGFRFSANYSYADVKRVEYCIWEVPDAAYYPGNNLFSANGKVLDTSDENNYTETSDVKLNLVLFGEHQNAGNERSIGEVELYFKGTRSTSDYTIDWKKADKTTSAVGEDILERGKKYVISYRVYTDYSITKHGTGGDHYYPDCVYPEGVVPLYRSAVLEPEKQWPTVERYQLSSNDTSETWNYRIIDPDNAIVTDGSGNATLYVQKAANYSDFDQVNSPYHSDMSAFTALASDFNVSNYSNDFAAYTINSLEKNKYYRIAVPILVSDHRGIVYRVSEPLLHKGIQTVTDGNIYLQGAVSTTNDYQGDLLYGTLGSGRLKPILNEGNYRYKLTFNGKDLDKFAAFRISVMDKDEGNEVIYDPVYIAYEGTSGTTPFGYAYIDQAPLADMEGHTVEFTITGYYSTNNVGFGEFASGRGEFTSIFDGFGGKSFYIGSSENMQESVYALKIINTGDSAYSEIYRSRTELGWSETMSEGKSVLGSIFVPGSSKGEGFTKTVIPSQTSSAFIRSRFFPAPIKTGTDEDTNPIQSSTHVVFSPTGAFDGSSYLNVEKLSYKSDGINIYQNETTTAKKFTFTQNPVTAAIKQEKLSPGALTATLDMSLSGVSTNKIYAKVYNRSGGTSTLMYLSKKTDGEITYYDVYDAVNPGNGAYDYGTTEFKNNTAIGAVDNKVFLRLRNLTPSTDYGVLFFVYGADNTTEVPLYCIDLAKTNAQYTFTTKNDIRININQPAYHYDSYSNKYANINFNVDGDDGAGIILSYKIVPGNDPSYPNAIASGNIEPLGTGNYKYYHSNPALNHPIKAALNPSSNNGSPLSLGGTYTVVIQANVYDWTDPNATPGDLRGTSSMAFTVPNRLDAPSFFTQISASSSQLKATVKINDTMKAVMTDYTVKLYDFTQIDETEDKATATSGYLDEQVVTPVFTADPADPSTTMDATVDTVTFDNLPIGTYLVRIVAQADLNNNGEFDLSENDIYVISDSMSTAGYEAKAELGVSATTDILTLDLRNLNNFDNVNDVFFTVYDISGNGTTVMSGTIPVTSDDKDNDLIHYELDWSDKEIAAGSDYRIQLQFRSVNGSTLGNTAIVVKPVAVNN